MGDEVADVVLDFFFILESYLRLLMSLQLPWFLKSRVLLILAILDLYHVVQ